MPVICAIKYLAFSVSKKVRKSNCSAFLSCHTKERKFSHTLHARKVCMRVSPSNLKLRRLPIGVRTYSVRTDSSRGYRARSYALVHPFTFGSHRSAIVLAAVQDYRTRYENSPPTNAPRNSEYRPLRLLWIHRVTLCGEPVLLRYIISKPHYRDALGKKKNLASEKYDSSKGRSLFPLCFSSDSGACQ